MSKITILLVLALTLNLVGCKNESEKKTNSTNLTNVKVDFSGVYFPMPGNYKEYKPSAILTEIKNQGLDEEIKDIVIGQIQRIEDRATDYIILHDESELSSAIHIESKPPIELSKGTSEIILAGIKQGVKQAYEGSGAQYSFLEQKYFGGKEAQIMKAKFELGIGPFKMWVTQYAISAIGKSLFITHSTMYPEDIEDNIKAMKFL